MNTQVMERPRNQTLTETVTVKYVNDPRAKGKPGSIRDVGGQYYSVWNMALLEQFRAAGEATCFVDYTVNDNGFRTATAMRPVASAPQPQQQQQRSAPVQQHVTPPQNGNGNGYRSPSPEDKKSMFRCACITAAIKSRQVTLDRNAIAALIVEVDAGYDMAMNTNDV